MASDSCVLGGIAAAFVITITSCFLLGYSFNTCEPNEWALKYDVQTRQIESGTLYRGGRVFTGLGKSFITFPATRQLMMFAGDSFRNAVGNEESSSVHKYSNLFVRSKDGLILDMSVAITFKVSLDGSYNDLMLMYRKTGEDGYVQLLKDMVQDSVRNVASKFEATKFYENRDEFNLEVQKDLATYMKDIHIQLYSFHMTNIDFPIEIEQAIQDTEIKRQNKLQTENNRQTQIIQAQTQTLVTQILVQQYEEQATAKANITTLSATYQASKVKDQLALRAEALKSVTDTLGYAATNDLLNFVWLEAVGGATGALTLDVDIPEDLVKGLSLK